MPELPMTYREVLERLPNQSCLAIDRRHLRQVIALRVAREGAAAQLRLAERALTVAAMSAYEAGDSWLAIGTVLGISRQAAQQRYGVSSPAVSSPGVGGLPSTAHEA